MSSLVKINRTEMVYRLKYLNRGRNDRNMFRFMVFNATFSIDSVISWWSVLLLEETGELEKTINLPQVTEKLDHIMLHPIHLAISGIRTHNVGGDRD